MASYPSVVAMTPSTPRRAASSSCPAGARTGSGPPAGPPCGPQAAEEAFARAVEHGDEHVIKFADTAADIYTRTGNPDALAAAVRATQLIER